MKKTLIALLALAGMACGADGDLTLLYDFQGIRNTGTGKGNLIVNEADYNQTVFDMKDAPIYQGITNTTMTNVFSGVDKTTCITLAFWVDPSSANYQMLFGWGESGKGFKFGIDNDKLTGTTKDVSNVGGGAIPEDGWSLIAVTYKAGSEAGKINITLRDATLGDNTKVWTSQNVSYNAPTDPTKFSILSAKSDGKEQQFTGLLASVGIYSSTGNISDVKNSDILEAMGPAPVSVPEPATATLSLPALAGLAARRRRRG